MTETSPPGHWISLEAAAARISVSRQTIIRLIARGHVVAAKIGVRRLVDSDSLVAHLGRCRDGLTTTPLPGATADETSPPRA